MDIVVGCCCRQCIIDWFMQINGVIGLIDRNLQVTFLGDVFVCIINMAE